MPKAPADFTADTGCVLPCKLCNHRVATDTPAEAWRAIYQHYRHHHRSEHAAHLAMHAERNWHRIKADSR